MATDFSKYGSPVTKTSATAQPTNPTASTPTSASAPVSTGGTDFSKYGAPIAKTTTQAQPVEQKSLLRKVGDFFTGGTQRFGTTIGESLAAPENADKYAQALSVSDEITNNLQKAIAQKQKLGLDTTRLQNALDTHIAEIPQLKQFTGNVIDKTAGQVLGEGVMAGVEALSGGILESGAKTLTTKALSTGGKLAEGAKIGAVYGGITGGAEEAAQGGNLGSIAESTTLGALAGGALGAGLAGTGIVGGKAINAFEKSAIGNKILPMTENRVNKITRWVEEAKVNNAKEYEKVMPLTPSQKMKEINLLNKTGDNTYTTLAKYNINAGSPEAINELQSLSDQFANATKIAQKNEKTMFNVSEMIANANKNIDEEINSSVLRQRAKNRIQEEVNAIMAENPEAFVKDVNGNIKANSDVMERLRKIGNDMTPFNSADPEKVGRSTGWSLANAVRDQVEKEGTFPSYRQANREWGKVIHAQEILQKIEDAGKTFKTPGGLSGAVARRVLSGVLGYHVGGIGGAVLTELGSEYAAKVVSNPTLRTYLDRKLIERFADTKATPEAINALVNEVQQYIDKQSKILKLPAAGKSSAPIIPAAPTTFESPAKVIRNYSQNVVQTEKPIIKTNTNIKGISKSVQPVEKLSSDEKLLKTLTPRQMEAFKKGSKVEQEKALEYLRLKNKIENLKVQSIIK